MRNEEETKVTSSRGVHPNLSPLEVEDAPRHGHSKQLSVWERLFAVKSVEDLQDQAEHSTLKRSLGAFELTLFGIGEIVGSGIFVLTGTAAAEHAGPAVVLSFIIAAIASLFAALCYSELASIIPVAGSAYTYSYATLGSWVAFTIGWDLCLEYMVGAATVCVGWSAYLQSFLRSLGVHVVSEWTSSPIQWDSEKEVFIRTGNYIDLPAMAIALFMTAVLVRGVRESAWVNSTAVIIKLLVIFVFVVVMSSKVDPANWEPFVPKNTGKFGQYGISGVFRGASVVFFAYIGFDSVSCCAQECRRPERDLPIGTLTSLVVCTALYIAVALVATGLVPYTQMGVANPISFAVSQVPGYGWLVTLIDIGAIAGLSSVILVSLLSQPRIFYSMSVDRFLPDCASKVHPKYQTPWVTTIISGCLCAVLAGILPIKVLSELTSVGTLFAFMLVCLGVMILRIRRPHLKRKFRVPLGPFVIPLLGALSSLGLIATADKATLYRLFAWMGVGWIVYFAYGFRRADPTVRNLPVDGDAKRGRSRDEGRVPADQY